MRGMIVDNLLTLARAARRVGVTSTWLKDEAKSGRVPCLKAGNRYLFDAETLVEVLRLRASLTTDTGVAS